MATNFRQEEVKRSERIEVNDKQLSLFLGGLAYNGENIFLERPEKIIKEEPGFADREITDLTPRNVGIVGEAAPRKIVLCDPVEDGYRYES